METAYGFSTVTGREEKQARVNDVFHRVAERYDLMNDLMSGGLHRVWKSAMVSWLSPPHRAGWNFIDVAGGTGDVVDADHGGSFVEVAGTSTLGGRRSSSLTVLHRSHKTASACGIQAGRVFNVTARYRSSRVVANPQTLCNRCKRLQSAWTASRTISRHVAREAPPHSALKRGTHQ